MKGLRPILCGLLVMGIAACGSGGGGSVSNTAPVISSVSPVSAPVGSAGFILTITGANFDSSSIVDFNGDQLNTIFVSTQQLQAKVDATDLTIGGEVSVVAYNQNDSSLSNSVQFTIVNPAPTINRIDPFSAPTGSPALTFMVNGNGFVPGSIVLWNGEALPTTYDGSALLQALLSATDVSNLGTFSVAVENPSPGGGDSSALTFQVFSYNQVNETAQDIVWDPQHQLIYLSVPSTATTNPNTITAVDPFTNTIVASQATGTDPNVLAISDSGQYLYAGIDGTASVQRFVLPSLQLDISYTLGSGTYGPYVATDLQVAPNDATTAAVSLGYTMGFPRAAGGIKIYDNAVPRPTGTPTYATSGDIYDSLQWGADANTLYAGDNESSGFDLYVLSVNSSGVTLSHDYPNGLDGSDLTGYRARIHYDHSTAFIYSDNGWVVNPGTGTLVGKFVIGSFGGVMTIDSSLDRAYFVCQLGAGGYVIESFNLTQFTPVNIVSVPQINGTPERLIRWGSDGLALVDSTGSVYLTSGPFVTE
ncbi:MAG TPA: IPT/TIG domain-containing protein [Candidatus Saccharimonadales bacterium]|nr:IPT/TIG domain-containing protein [Candidatus Saccharimonadales bacterium]